MTQDGFFLIMIYFLIICLLVKPLGWYMARVYENKPCGLDIVLGPIERLFYKISGIQVESEMGWKSYLTHLLAFNFVGFLVIYAIARLQGFLPLNPQHFAGVRPDLAFNIASSFTTNTNWQSYAGENTLSYFTQMIGITVQNFASAATGMALLVAFIRGLVRQESNNLGNFWVDLVRGTLYILLPLAIILAILLANQGVIQNFQSYQSISLMDPEASISEQIVPMGPVASQVAIKQLGTNGGGFFNVNSAHPFENPTFLSNFLEMLAILLIPAALCYTFGIMVKDKRQGWAIFISMLLLFIPFLIMTVCSESHGNPLLNQLNIVGGNMEGKETRFGIVSSSLWATATTATSNGSVNAMHDSFMPISGLALMSLMHFGEVVFGGVGSGLYGMLMLVIMTVFVAGLLVGRTPEYLGKKIQPFEMKMASVAVLLLPLIVLILTAIGSQYAAHTIGNPGPYGLSEILYAFTSMGSNNGSAFAGLDTDQVFYNVLGGIEMLILRFWVAIPVLALAGSLVRKKIIPPSMGTLRTHTFLFIILLMSVTVIIAALSFFPVLALGPIVEHLTLWGQHG